MPRFAAILVRPSHAWSEIRAADPGWAATFFGYALPLTLLPALAWPSGRSLAGPAAEGFAGAFAATFLLTMACHLLFAAALFALAPIFGAIRDWNRAVALACYSATPVLLCGALLVIPVLVIASVGGLLLAIGVCATGMPVMLGCRSDDVPAYLATAAFCFGLASIALGALCSAIGLI